MTNYETNVPDSALSEYDAMQDSLGNETPETDGAPVMICGGEFPTLIGMQRYCPEPAVLGTQGCLCWHHGMLDCMDIILESDELKERDLAREDLANYEAARKLEVGNG